MLPRRTLLIAAAITAAAGGSAVAIAATTADDAKKEEAQVLGDAAKSLGVQTDELRKALTDALNAQLDRAVKAGKLTQEQADAIKKRRADSGTVLPLGPGFRGPGRPGGGRHGDFRGGPGPGHHQEEAAAIAKVLGISTAELQKRLQAGETLAQIAKAENKDVADVKAAMKKVDLAELDAAVKAGRLTKAQRDEIAKDIDARIDDKVNGTFHGGHGHGHGFKGGPHGPPPAGAPAPGNENGSLPAPPPGELSPA